MSDPGPTGRRGRRETVGRPAVGLTPLGRALEPLVGVGPVALACTLSLTAAPTAVRSLVSLPIVVLVAGRAVTLLVLGRDRAVLGTTRRTLVDEGMLRAVAPLLLGVIAALGSVLVLDLVLRVRITTSSVVLAVGVLAAALHVAAGVGRRTPSRRTSWRRVGLLVRGVWLPALAAVLLLVVATGGARALEAQRVERYTQLTLLDPALYRQGGLVAAPGARVTVGWVLRGYDEPLPAHPPVALTVAGAPATDVRTVEQAPPVDATGATAARAGTVVATAPDAPGLYRVALTVGGTGDGTGQTLYLVLEVRS